MEFYFYEQFACSAHISSSVSSMYTLASELEEKSCADMTSTSSEVEMEHYASAVGPVSYSHSAKNGTRDHYNNAPYSNFEIPSESADPDGLSMESSQDMTHGKKERMFRNDREISNACSLPWNDSDDDFRESMYNVPLAQRVNGTCEDGLFSRSSDTMSYDYHPVQTYTRVPSQNEFSSDQVNAELAYASRSQLPHVLSASSDEFGVRGLVDSFIDGIPPTRRQNELNCGKTRLHNACKKNKFSESKHKSSKEYPSTIWPSSLLDADMPESALNAGNCNNEVQAGNSSEVFAGTWADPGDNVHTSSVIRHCDQSKDTQMAALGTDDFVGTGTQGTSRRHRHRRKRQINFDDCFDKTFDILDEQTENASQSQRSKFATMARFTDTALDDVLECPKSSSSLKPRKEKVTKSSYVTAVHSGSLSNARENSDVDVDGVSVSRNGLRDIHCRSEYAKKTADRAVGKQSATVGNVSSEYARSGSVIASKQKKSKLWPSSSVGNSSRRNHNHVSAVPHDFAGSSRASSLFSRAGKNDTVSRCRSSAAVDSSHEDVAIHDEMNAQDTSSSHHVVGHTGGRLRLDNGDSVDDHTQNAAASVRNSDNSGSLKERLKNIRRRLHSHGRRILLDSDDDNDDDNRTDGRSVVAHHTQNAAVSVNNISDSRSDRGRLQSLISRGRRILFDDDDDDDVSELPVDNHSDLLSTGNTARLRSELSVHDVSSGNDVIVIGSDDERSADTESVNEQSLSDVQQASGIEIGTTTAQEQNSGSSCETTLPRLHRRKTARNARMSCG